MGLDTSHDCWHGSYGSYNIFRDAVAMAAGYDAYPDDADSLFDRWGVEPKNFYGEWDKYPGDPLIVFLAHADNEGKIPHDITADLATRMEECAAAMRKDDWHRDSALRFARGLRRAHEEQEDVIYS